MLALDPPERRNVREAECNGKSFELNFPQQTMSGMWMIALPAAHIQTGGTAGLESVVPNLLLLRWTQSGTAIIPDRPNSRVRGHGVFLSTKRAALLRCPLN